MLEHGLHCPQAGEEEQETDSGQSVIRFRLMADEALVWGLGRQSSQFLPSSWGPCVPWGECLALQTQGDGAISEGPAAGLPVPGKPPHFPPGPGTQVPVCRAGSKCSDVWLPHKGRCQCLLGPGSGFPHHRGSDGDEQSCLQTLGPWGPGVPSREDVSGSCIATPGE